MSITNKLPRMIMSLYHPRYQKLSPRKRANVCSKRLQMLKQRTSCSVSAYRLSQQCGSSIERVVCDYITVRSHPPYFCRQVRKLLIVQFLQRKSTAKSAALTWEIEESKDRLEYEGVMKSRTPLSKWRALDYTSIQSTHILVLHLMGSQAVPAVVMGFLRSSAIIVYKI